MELDSAASIWIIPSLLRDQHIISILIFLKIFWDFIELRCFVINNPIISLMAKTELTLLALLAIAALTIYSLNG